MKVEGYICDGCQKTFNLGNDDRVPFILCGDTRMMEFRLGNPLGEIKATFCSGMCIMSYCLDQIEQGLEVKR